MKGAFIQGRRYHMGLQQQQKTRFQWDSSNKNLGFPGLHEKRAKTSWDSVGDSKKTACSDSRKKTWIFFRITENFIRIT